MSTEGASPTASERVGPERSGSPPEAGSDARRSLATYAVYAVLALLLYTPSLTATFYSDDMHYVVYNEYLQNLTAANLRDVLDPYGTSAMMTQNYAPVHLLGHSLAWHLFGTNPLGHHVVNVLLHALGSLFLALLLARSGASWRGASLGGAVFLLHPVNVEAVAWISQLKTDLAFVLGLGALLLRERRPGWATSLFVLALLTKALAAFVLPLAVLYQWLQPGKSQDARRDWIVLGGWGAIFVAYTWLEFPLFSITNANAPALHPEWMGQLRGVLVVGARYLVMAATSSGVSAFHELAPTDSWLEPWPAFALLIWASLGSRAVYTLLHRRVEAIYWGWALVSFLPVSQVFPFLYPMGDRYLYFILPGLIGGVIFAGRSALGRVPEAHQPLASRVALGVALVWLLGISVHTVQRTRVWSDPALVDLDAIQRYPDGLLANIRLAQQAALRGDADEAVARLNATVDRGNYHLWSLQSEPTWDPVRDHPGFQDVLVRMARYWVEVEPKYQHPSQLDLRAFADAYMLLGDYDAAEERLKRALEVEGLRDDEVRMQLVKLRIRRERERESEAP